MKKLRYWKKAAACAFALAFLLSACGASTAGSEGAAPGDYYAVNSPQAAGGSYAVAAEEAYSSAYRDDYDYDEIEDLSEEEVEMEMAADEAMPLASVSGSDAGAASGSAGSSKAADGDEEQADLKSSNRKIIYTGNISIQTLEYDKSSQSIHDKIAQSGGFIESEDTYNEDPYWYYSDRSGSAANRTRRNLSITARIPAEKFDAFMKDLEDEIGRASCRERV